MKRHSLESGMLFQGHKGAAVALAVHRKEILGKKGRRVLAGCRLLCCVYLFSSLLQGELGAGQLVMFPLFNSARMFASATVASCRASGGRFLKSAFSGHARLGPWSKVVLFINERSEDKRRDYRHA